jgi:hypothetical protein
MELADFRLESHSEVRLFYKDGRQKLVVRDRLGKYLLPDDVTRVQNAFKLRQSYFNDLPKWVKVIGIGMLAFGLGLGGVKASPGIQHAIHQVVPMVPDVPTPAVSQSTPKVMPPSRPATVPAAPLQRSAPVPAAVTPQQVPVTTPVANSVTAAKSSVNLPSVRLPVPAPILDVRATLRAPLKLLQNLRLE